MSSQGEALFDSSKTRYILGIVVFTLCTIIPALGYAGFMFRELIGMNTSLLYAISGIGTMAAFFVTNYKRIIPNLICGPLTGLGTTFATVFYLSNRSSIIKLELIIPMALGVLPGILLYYFLTRKTK